jgi:methionyl aminopeptidase
MYNIDDVVLEHYMKAGKAVAAALKLGRLLARPGTKLLDLGSLIEGEIKKNGAELSFPVNLSLDTCAAHYSPIIEDPTIIPPQGLLKIDCGAHVEGYIADAAITINLGHEDGLKATLVKAAEEAIYAAVKHFKPGVSVKEIGSYIQREIEKYPGLKPISNLGGHQLKQYNLHAGTFIPNNSMGGDNYKLKEGDQFAVEPFSTNGIGLIKDGPEMTIFRIESIAKKKNPPMQDRLRLEKFKKTFKTLPFSPRWIDFLPKDQINDAITRYLHWGVISGYHTFVERGNGLVAQAEHTLIVTKDGGLPTTWWEDFDYWEK